jgi:hypothetical protein
VACKASNTCSSCYQLSHSINAIDPAPHRSGRKREHCSRMFASITHIPSLHKILSNTCYHHLPQSSSAACFCSAGELAEWCTARCGCEAAAGLAPHSSQPAGKRSKRAHKGSQHQSSAMKHKLAPSKKLAGTKPLSNRQPPVSWVEVVVMDVCRHLCQDSRCVRSSS